MKLSKCSQLYRELAKQGYFKKSGKEPKPEFKLTTKGMAAMYLLASQLQRQGILWDECIKVGLSEKFTKTPVILAKINNLNAIKMNADSLIKLEKKENETKSNL